MLDRLLVCRPSATARAASSSRRFTHEICQPGLLKTHETIAMNTAFVVESHRGADGDLGRQALPLCEYWRADHCRVGRIDQRLATHDNESSSRLRVTG